MPPKRKAAAASKKAAGGKKAKKAAEDDAEPTMKEKFEALKKADAGKKKKTKVDEHCPFASTAQVFQSVLVHTLFLCRGDLGAGWQLVSSVASATFF